LTCYFLDSSALIKRYILEQGTVWMRAIVAPSAGNTLLVSRITPVEVISGVCRRQREGAVTPRVARAVRVLLTQHLQRDYRAIDLVEHVIQQSQDLLERYPLRAYDAIQLASALEGQARLISAELAPLIFVSADTRLLAAASAEGLSTDDPNSHP
jgi:uncharacterized protein